MNPNPIGTPAEEKRYKAWEKAEARTKEAKAAVTLERARADTEKAYVMRAKKRWLKAEQIWAAKWEEWRAAKRVEDKAWAARVAAVLDAESRKWGANENKK